jgi:subtilisin
MMNSPHLFASQSTKAALLSLMVLTLTVVDRAAVIPLFAQVQAQQSRPATAAPAQDKQKLPEASQRPTGQPQRDAQTLQARPEATRTRALDADAKPAAAQREPQAAKIAAATSAAVTPDALPNLTPFTPAGWSAPIVVSTVTGNHADGSPLRSTDTLYVDWAVLNNGDATSVRFFTKLYVDGVERASWFTDPPLSSSSYAYIEDYSIGTLSVGTHTLRIVGDALNNITESNEFDNEYTKTIIVSSASQPNLTPFTPSGWSDRIVVSTITGNHTDAGLLRSGDTLYVDWAVLNNGVGPTTARFYTKLYVDGVERGSWFFDPPLATNTYTYFEDFSIGTLSVGTHTLRVVADALSNIAESNEFDNEYTKTITVTTQSQPNLTPFTPSGWSAPIVVSTVTGGHTDSGSISPTSTVYVDWAAINNGGAATGVRFIVKLYVDGAEKGSWFTDPPLNPNSYAFIEDFPIGTLSTGAHTLRLVADALNNIAESNESDNEYTRPITVAQQPCASITVNVTPTNAGTVGKTPENCTGLLDLPVEPDAVPQSVSDRPTEIISPDGIRRSAEMTAAFRSLIAKAETDGTVRIIVKLRTDFQPEGTMSIQAVQSQRNTIAEVGDVLLARMTTFNVQGVKRFKTVPYIGMLVDADSLRYLENSADASNITEDLPLPPLLDMSVSLVGAPNAWLSGFSGAGQVVAILDTGIDKNHPFLAGKVVAEGCSSTSSATTSSLCPGGVPTSTISGSGLNCNVSLVEACSHGTHVAGIAAGRSASFSGVAKDANLMAFQVFTRFNSSSDCDEAGTPCVRTYPTDQMWALEQVLTLSNSYHIAAINMSLGGGKFTANCDTNPLKSLIDSLRSRGIATVIASGNEGYSDGLSSPGCISSAVSVGSTDSGKSGTAVDAISMFRPPDGSNSASFLKLLAPGQPIYSSVPGTGYDIKVGTSMATPHVAGAWAVLKSKFPSASVDQILAALISTGRPVTDPRNGITKPRIQVDAALNALGDGGDGGSVLRYTSGNTVTLTATANAGYSFVKWQQDGFDYSISPTISVTVSSSVSHSMMAVFRQGGATTISSVTVASAKLVIISGSGFGSSPIVLVDGTDHSDYISTASDTTITMRGKLKKMGLKTGIHNVQVIGANGSSNIFTVTVF